MNNYGHLHVEKTIMHVKELKREILGVLKIIITMVCTAPEAHFLA